MKKILFSLFAVSLLMVGCNKQPAEEEMIVLPDPSTKDVAMSIRFDKGEMLNLELPERAKPNDPDSAIPNQYVELTISAIDLTEDSRYVLYYAEKVTKTFSIDAKGVLMGSCDHLKGYVDLKGVGNLTVDEGGGKIKFDDGQGGQQVALDATVQRIQTTSVVAANLARNWKVKSTYVKVEGGKEGQTASVSRNFVGCDLHEIARFIKEKNFPLSDADVAQLAGYNLTELNFIGNSNMIMNFDGPESYYGTWNVSGNTVTWEMNDSNLLLSAKATGTVSFSGNNSAQLLVNTDVAFGDGKYTGIIRFDLEQVNINSSGR